MAISSSFRQRREHLWCHDICGARICVRWQEDREPCCSLHHEVGVWGCIVSDGAKLRVQCSRIF